VLLQSPE